MRGLTVIEQSLMQSLIDSAPAFEHDAGVPYSDTDCIVFERLRMLGRIESFTCAACGCVHPRLTSAGLEALRLDRYK